MSYIRATYHFKETISRDVSKCASQQTLQVTRGKLEKDENLSSRTKWSVDEIMKLLEISIDTFLKTIDGNIYF